MSAPSCGVVDRDDAVWHIAAQGVVVRAWPPPDLDAGPQTWRAPTLHLVAPDAPPPPCGELDDWVRLPASDDELRARADTLLIRARDATDPSVVLDGDGVLRVAGRTIILSPGEHALLTALLARVGGLTPLVELGGPEGAGGPVIPKRSLASLRAKLRGHPLAIETVRGRGLVLSVGATDPGSTSSGARSSTGRPT